MWKLLRGAGNEETRTGTTEDCEKKEIETRPYQPQINKGEHKDFKIIPPGEALKMDLIEDEDSCIKLFYRL